MLKASDTNPLPAHFSGLSATEVLYKVLRASRNLVQVPHNITLLLHILMQVPRNLVREPHNIERGPRKLL